MQHIWYSPLCVLLLVPHGLMQQICSNFTISSFRIRTRWILSVGVSLFCFWQFCHLRESFGIGMNSVWQESLLSAYRCCCLLMLFPPINEIRAGTVIIMVIPLDSYQILLQWMRQSLLLQLQILLGLLMYAVLTYTVAVLVWERISVFHELNLKADAVP